MTKEKVINNTIEKDIVCNINSIEDKEIKLDQQLNDTLHNLKNDTMDVLMKYVDQFNNKETRDNIYNDLKKLLTEKYSNLMKLPK